MPSRSFPNTAITPFPADAERQAHRLRSAPSAIAAALTSRPERRIVFHGEPSQCEG
jgi:hypothetical protein